jgi:hypothetical protein
MKNSRKHIILFFVLSTFLLPMGCADFLDRQPLDQRSRETYFTSETEIQTVLNSTYRRLRSTVIGGFVSGNGTGSSLDFEALTDNGWTDSGFMNLQNFGTGTNTSSSNNGASNTMWEQCWQGVSDCNFFLDNLERPEVKALVSDATYRRFRGEVLFNRSLYYHLLLEHFGALPWVDRWVTAEMPFLEMPRLPKSQIVDNILLDLTEAIEGLPLPAAGYTNGRAIQSSAIMLKVRVLMANHRFQEAITAAELLINHPNNPHRIVDSFSGIFFGEQTNNREIIFSVQYNGAIDRHSYDFVTGTRQSSYPLGSLAMAFGKQASGAPDPRLRFTMFVPGDPWLMNTLKNPDGTPLLGTAGTITFPYPYDLGTFTFTNGQFPARLLHDNGAGGLQGLRIVADGEVKAWSLGWRKGIDPANNDFRQSVSLQDRVMMRYADLLLLYAEAKVEVDGGTTTDPAALAAFNAVRTRSSVNMPAVAEITRETVRNERRVELAYEGIRLYDILRWNIGHEVIPTRVVDGTVVGGKATSLSMTTIPARANVAGSNGITAVPQVWRGNLWPIPQNVMNIMEHWEQNP